MRPERRNIETDTFSIIKQREFLKEISYKGNFKEKHYQFTKNNCSKNNRKGAAKGVPFSVDRSQQ